MAILVLLLSYLDIQETLKYINRLPGFPRSAYPKTHVHNCDGMIYLNLTASLHPAFS